MVMVTRNFLETSSWKHRGKYLTKEIFTAWQVADVSEYERFLPLFENKEHSEINNTD